MGRLVALRSPKVLIKGSALLLCIVLLVVLHTEEKTEAVMKISHGGDCSSIMGEMVSSRERSMESTQLVSLNSKRRVPKGPDPIHNRRSGNGQKPPGKS